MFLSRKKAIIDYQLKNDFHKSMKRSIVLHRFVIVMMILTCFVFFNRCIRFVCCASCVQPLGSDFKRRSNLQLEHKTFTNIRTKKCQNLLKTMYLPVSFPSASSDWCINYVSRTFSAQQSVLCNCLSVRTPVCMSSGNQQKAVLKTTEKRGKKCTVKFRY